MTSFLKSLSSNSLSKHKSQSIKISVVQPQQLNHFPKALATNDDRLFVYIKHLISGPTIDQKNYNQYIFNHLKNTIDHQFNTLTLRNTCKFIMTLILLGNLHIYENIIKYLLPGMVNKVNEFISKTQKQRKDQIKPVWHLSEFCMQTLFVLAQWLPEDFLNPQKPSIFAKIKQKYNLQIKDFKYFNIDKIVFCYRIIKDLAINTTDPRCYKCESKSGNKMDKNGKCNNFKKRFHEKSNLQNRKNMFLKQNTKRKKDLIWETGFQVFEGFQQIQQQTPPSQQNSQVSDDMKIKSKRFWSPDQYEFFNKKQLELKQTNLIERIKKINKNVKQVGQNLYNLEQRKILKQYDIKNKNEFKLKFNNQQKNQRQINQNISIQQDVKASKFNLNEMSTARKQKYIPSFQQLIPLKSPRNRLIKKYPISNHIQIFTNYLNLKPLTFLNNFKIALISPNGNIHLKKMINFTLKCKTSCKQNMLKLKIFVQQNKKSTIKEETKQVGSNSNYMKQIQPSKLGLNSEMKDSIIQIEVSSIKIEFIEPKNCLQFFRQDEDGTQLIINYESHRIEKGLIMDPILIKLNNEMMYLPVGYWHMVKKSSKQMSVILFQKMQSKIQMQQSKRLLLLYKKQNMTLSKNIVKSFKQMVIILQRQFSLQKYGTLNNEIQQQSILRGIKLKGQIMDMKFVIQITNTNNQQNGQISNINNKQSEQIPNINNKQNEQTNINFKGYIIANLNDYKKQKHHQIYIQSFVQELIFIFCTQSC